MTIYLDVIWLLNFSIDFMLLWLTSVILKRKITFVRLMIGAFFGSLYVLMLFLESSLVYHPIVKFIYSVFIIYCTFGYKRFGSFVQGLFMFYFASFITGGGIFGIHFFLQTEAEIMNGVLTTQSTGMGDPVSWLFVILMVPVMLYFTKRRVGDIEIRKLRYDQIMNFELRIETTILKGQGLLDSGNQLHEPISKTPVMILDLTVFKNDLPEEVISHATSLENIGEVVDEENPWIDRMKIIPYRAVGSNHQFLMGVKADHMAIWSEGVKYETKNVIVGLSFTNVSGEGDYQAILHPKMLSHASVTSSAS
ncbi:sigma-E processing peptidase SpoIIGA [Pseudalkalibacillus berkeleyi]|uniref:Sporulation sigma-E factor-processing peptidase n=1 Tax=Pseudalkalibacillus berkeleyi TaxID=1069813 RepID=A0ABS9GZ26_9BACL|nr:sigma-E processing peptidase SpoIIGA [Pseudalkalibacillus berkeleyi]MCF6137021.1 sigma-E processing peptidase SpoIIGA [Pseudalkalibacillus berkeleyi]